VSLKSSLWRYLGLLAVAALAVGVLAGPASAKKLSAKQRAAVRTQLKKQIKKNPAIVNRKSFVKRASLVNFKLPITIRLRAGDSGNNPNAASIDLGASLGQRSVSLGGSLSGELTFHDSYDGGALGNVDLAILPSANHHLKSTSIPLLWNDQVSQAGGRFDANSLNEAPINAGLTPGCADFTSSATNGLDNPALGGIFGAGHLNFGVGVLNSGAGVPGYPFFDAQPLSPAQAPDGYLPISPGIDGIDKIAASKVASPATGTADSNLGANVNPFPYSADSNPDGAVYAPSVRDTVLRTNALDLNVAPAGHEVKQDGNTTGNDSNVSGSQNIVIGKSGGQANLFGNIPGKGYGIDVTVSLATRINSILRVVDQDSFGTPLLANNRYPAGVFNCRQIWTGGIDNYIPDIRLKGSLKIAPGITSDGKLRIAKATVSSLPGSEARFAVAACLAPYAGFDADQNGSDTVGTAKIPSSASAVTIAPSVKVVPAALLPAKTDVQRATPAADCNTAPLGLVADSAMAPSSVQQLTPAVGTDGYTTTNSGSSVSVAADLAVSNISLDILVGDVQ
jgi:hypothetical protein